VISCELEKETFSSLPFYLRYVLQLDRAATKAKFLSLGGSLQAGLSNVALGSGLETIRGRQALQMDHTQSLTMMTTFEVHKYQVDLFLMH